MYFKISKNIYLFQHDYPKECRPGGAKGNYIMYASATSGDRPHNNKFSECSIHNISAVLRAVFSNEGKENCFESMFCFIFYFTVHIKCL